MPCNPGNRLGNLDRLFGMIAVPEQIPGLLNEVAIRCQLGQKNAIAMCKWRDELRPLQDVEPNHAKDLVTVIVEQDTLETNTRLWRICLSGAGDIFQRRPGRID